MFPQLLTKLQAAIAVLNEIKAGAPDYLDKVADGFGQAGQFARDVANYMRQPHPVSAAAPGGPDHRAELAACRAECDRHAADADQIKAGLADALAGCCDKLAGHAA